MAGIVVLQGPKALTDTPLGYCAVCSGVGKFFAIAEIRGAIEKHERSGTGTKTFALQVPREFLQRAVAWSMIPGMGMAAPVCWSHLSAIQPSSGGIIPVQGALPPGLGGNGGGIPLLGQG